MNSSIRIFTLLSVFVFLMGCKEEKKTEHTSSNGTSPTIKNQEVSAQDTTVIKEKPEGIATPDGMVWIPGAIIEKGAVPQDQMAMEHEKPAHKVAVDGFYGYHRSHQRRV